MAARQGEALRLLARMERDEWLSTDEIRARQWERLRCLLAHAGRHVPFYRAFFAEAGLDPASLRGPEVLKTLPVVTKEMLRTRRDEFRSDDAASRGATSNATGGTTGEPLTFLQDDLYRLHRQAAMYRGFRGCGWRIGGPLAYLWGSDINARAPRGPRAVRDAL